MGSCGDLDFLRSNVSAAVSAQYPRDSRRRRPAERSGPRGRKPGSGGRFGLSSRSRTPGPPPRAPESKRGQGLATEAPLASSRAFPDNDDSDGSRKKGRRSGRRGFWPLGSN
ncbi:unnamed protein product [Ixodes persulcatus]